VKSKELLRSPIGKKTELDESFLKEERSLIDAVQKRCYYLKRRKDEKII